MGSLARSPVVDGFVGDAERFEVDSLRDREPVEVLKDGGDVVREWVLCVSWMMNHRGHRCSNPVWK